MSALWDPVRALRVLNAHHVRFVVIGGFAGNLLGSPSITHDLDVCYERTRGNCDALARALAELHATLRGAPPGLPFHLDGRTIFMGDSFTFDTDAGALDCLGTPSGTKGYADLVAGAEKMVLHGMDLAVASIDDVIRMKRAADRPKDRIEVEVLTALKEERERSS
jgi:hypothetical protein